MKTPISTSKPATGEFPGFRLNQLPLRWVLILPFALQTVGLGLLIGFLSYQNGQRSVNELVNTIQAEVESKICEQLDGYFATPPQINQINADAYALGHLNISNFKTTGQYFWRQLKVFDVSFIDFANAQGGFIGAGDFGNNTIRIEEIPLNTPGKSYQYKTDGQGNRVQLASVQSYDPLTEDWFTKTVKAKKPTWSNIYNWDGLPHIMSIAVSHPVYTQNGTLLGVFGVDLKLSKINDFLNQLKIGKSGKAFIVERSGMLVASSVTEPPFMMVKGEAQRLPARQSKDIDIRLTTQALQTEWGSFKNFKGNYRLTLDIEGQKKYVQVSPWHDKLGLNWLVVLVLPESDFMAQIHANTLKTALFSLFAILVSIVLGILTARWIARPVLHLSEASQKFAQAAQRRLMVQFLKDSSATSSIQELETLSQSFYHMGNELQLAFSELEDANRELEDRVTQRTQALEEANLQIVALNTQLQTDNLRMGAELEVTRRLQNMMLPKPAELSHLEELDIACFMEAAQEVGGDYYDVIPGDDSISVGIGDVTGHGLESGILMVMAQTAVRTLVAMEETEPKRFLNTLNQVLYENALRLSPGKTMTFSLVTYQDQRLHISGQHEDVLVFRTNGTVEEIDTVELGMPLGMMENIQEFVGQIQIRLNPGDGVVLYTDGITEAEGPNRTLYGRDRLISVIQKAWHQSAEEIQAQVIEDVRSHRGNCPIYDDMTLVIFKQNPIPLLQ